MKKISKGINPQEYFKIYSAITASKLLTDRGIIISKSNIENYKLWMKKPFTGWVLGAKYSKTINFKNMIINDCIALHNKQMIDECIEEIRNNTSNHLILELNKPTQIIGIKKIAAKKVAKK